MSQLPYNSVLTPPEPASAQQNMYWGRLYGSALGLALRQLATRHSGLILVIAEHTTAAQQLHDQLAFYLGNDSPPLLHFPDWETLPYDIFSPHQDITSERLECLYRLPGLQQGVLVVPVQTLMNRLAPRAYIEQRSLVIRKGETLVLDSFRERLVKSGYSAVSAVMEHGEFAVRGALLDLYPMGSALPFRIELFDDDVDTIRTFDPETQRTIDVVDQLRLLPAREFPLDETGIRQFRQAYRVEFEGDPQQSTIYRDVSDGLAPPGIEYYLPLFFEQTSTLFDYLPANTLIVTATANPAATAHFYDEIVHRHEQGRHDRSRPLLAPERVFLTPIEMDALSAKYPTVTWQSFEYEQANAINFASEAPPSLVLDVRAAEPTDKLKQFLAGFDGRVLFTAETTGRRETLLELLREHQIQPRLFENWAAFETSDARLGITVAPLEHGLLLSQPRLAVIAESQLFGQQVLQRRRRKSTQRDTENIVRNLAELNIGSPVVHEEYGVGRYLGLQILEAGGMTGEFLMLEYADHDKLYVPVSSLHLISRYTGVSPETAPLHKLGSGQWERAKRKASERVRDVAAELLNIYAKREARVGYAYPLDEAQYRAFCAQFPFEETPDQQAAIDHIAANMRAPQPMDHLICGDVGFGKTEVAMRAAFIAVMAGKQVAVLAPTTLLTQQHAQTFRDRFADWPVRVESLSRFRSKKEQDKVIKELSEGKIDIVIGTHKLLQEDVKYKNLGLVIIDEEHRFGVRQKERFKALRAEVDILTLTATPIPRTLNMAMSGMRDLSIIATPPARRLAIKTFVSQWNDQLIVEACTRELKRGGQVFFVHNEVETIERQAEKIHQLLPEARVGHAHGQMRERELEQVMSDFYHQRFNILVCTTIIETGIDIPNANTIIINRADRFGLAQLYQLRGRVGRSHHRAYAYLIIPHISAITDDARKRLEAIESIETLGAGFTLATHDLEIRGAGELLGDEQSGQIQEIGFTLYTELLERAVKALKEGKTPDVDLSDINKPEVDLHLPALIPEDYLPDVHERLIMYKRIASAEDEHALRELQVEMIDRFGLLPSQVKNLFDITRFKNQAANIGIKKIDIGASGGRVVFVDKPNIDPMRVIELIQTKSSVYKLDGKDKLRISQTLDDPGPRLKFVADLLQHLVQQQAA
ncbi:MAG: transcription-repair coupling factor [Gammaproteobacteria bacterium]|nr:transcription-repair coupling factor [Gammaproteobacteria bacterium]